MAGALFIECTICNGSGDYQKPERSGINLQDDYSGTRPSDCVTCNGYGILPTPEGEPMFALIKAMQSKGKKAWFSRLST